MKKQETNSTSKTFEVEYTEADIQEMRDNGYAEEDLPRIGKHNFRRARHFVPRNQQKLKVTIMLDADILDFYKERAAEQGNLPYQTQINRELRNAMDNAKQPKSEVVTMEMFDNPQFLAKLAEKLKLAA